MLLGSAKVFFVPRGGVLESLVGLHAGVVEHGDKNRIYNIAGNHEASNKDVVAMILESYLKKKVPIEDYVKFNYVRMGEDIRYSLDDSAFRRLGWKNKKVFKREIKKVVDNYRKKFIW